MNERYPVKIRRGWRRISENDRRYKLFEEVYAYAKSIQKIPANVEKPLLFEIVSGSICGKCIWRIIEGRIYSSILLNKAISPFPDDAIRKVLVHELAHACTAKDHHGWKWYTFANELGKKWGYHIDRLEDNLKIGEAVMAAGHYKYEVYCPACGFSLKRTRSTALVKKPQEYRCPMCKTPLKSREIQEEKS